MNRMKDVMNQACRERSDLHVLTEEELVKIRRVYLDMADDIFAVCEKYGLTAMLAGGSCLGAIRHNGFIPWDDDMDIYMFRKDYEVFMKVFDKELGDKYKFTGPTYKDGFSRGFGRVENPWPIMEDTRGRKHGLFLDVFPLENVPNNKTHRKIHGLISYAYYYAAAQVKYYESTDREYMKTMFPTGKGRMIYYTKMAAGKILSFNSAKKWYRLADKHNQYKDGNSKYVTCPTGRGHYFGEMYERSDVDRTILHQFEDRTYPIPYNWERHLRQLYGDYMQIPPENKREQHWVKSVDFCGH